ncbi:MAG: hypothetical protein QOC92_28 [Acidimicrobiaceae bacterium]|jgi:hypothetical protein
MEAVRRRELTRESQGRRSRALIVLTVGALLAGCGGSTGAGQRSSEKPSSVASADPAVPADCPPSSGGGTQPSGPAVAVDYVNFVQLDGVSYLASSWPDALPAGIKLGPPVATVCREVSTLSGIVGPRDRDAGFLAPGTSLLRIDGHDSRVAIAAEFNGRMTLFEADSNPTARTGGELFDYSSGLSRVRILDGISGTHLVRELTDPEALGDLARAIMSARVDQATEQPHRDDDRWFVELTTPDGLTTGRAFWRSTGELSRGVFLDTAAVHVLENGH